MLTENTGLSIGVLVAIVGCFIGITGYLTGRDKKIVCDAEWKGSIGAKLDMILTNIAIIPTLSSTVAVHENRINAIEQNLGLAECKSQNKE